MNGRPCPSFSWERLKPEAKAEVLRKEAQVRAERTAAPKATCKIHSHFTGGPLKGQAREPFLVSEGCPCTDVLHDCGAEDWDGVDAAGQLAVENTIRSGHFAR